MRIHQNPFKVEHLDFMIVDRAIRYTPNGRFTEEDSGVLGLYNFFGRWFSKQFIIDRINYINEVSQKEGKHIPSFMEANGNFQNAFQELNEFYNNKRKAEENEDKSQIIDIDTEIILEINNLCHFNEKQKMFGLLKKYRFLDIHEGNCGIYIRTFVLQQLEGLPKNMVLFKWDDDGISNILCFVSMSDDANIQQAFNLEGSSCCIQRDLNLHKIVTYSGPDYTSMFHMVGDDITCCNPPLIRHKYRLMPLYIPGDDFCLRAEPEYFNKYYDLYHTGNWNARHAIERGGFNLNG